MTVEKNVVLSSLITFYPGGCRRAEGRQGAAKRAHWCHQRCSRLPLRSHERRPSPPACENMEQNTQYRISWQLGKQTSKSLYPGEESQRDDSNTNKYACDGKD